MPHHAVHLFQKGLQLHDNPMLLAALESWKAVYPVYILDRKFTMSVMHIGALRWHFLLQSLEDLQKNLCQRGSFLLVIQGEILDLNGGTPPLTYKRFLHILSLLGDPEVPGRGQNLTAEDFQKYLPILKNFPSKYTCEPWTASEEEQKQAGCIIDQHYPFPMVSHREASDHNLQLMKQVREEQYRRAQLTTDDRHDPMEMKVKHDHSEDNMSKGRVAGVTEQTKIPSGITHWEQKNGKRGEPEVS